MPLEEYHRKRDFAKTPEPAGDEPAAGRARAQLRRAEARGPRAALRLPARTRRRAAVVGRPEGAVARHARQAPRRARRGPPARVRRLRGHHPRRRVRRRHRRSSGTAARGSRSATRTPALEKGDLKFDLFGEKLHGRWVLVRMRPRPGEKRENWLLIKEKDEFVRPADEYDVIARGAEQRADRPKRRGGQRPPGLPGEARRGRVSRRRAASIPATLDGQPASIPARSHPAARSPQRPRPLASHPAPDRRRARYARRRRRLEGEGWLAEAKYDGYRLVLALDGGRARAFTRSHADWSDRFAPLVRAVEGLPAVSAVLDGEAVVFDEEGVSRFELLQTALGAHPERIAFAAFDLLFLNGHDLRDMPLAQRKELLRTLLADEGADSLLRYADHVDSSARELYAHACSAGLEGVVCKRADSRYVAGRGRDWQKVKCRHTQELVVGGFTEGQGSRGALGSLLVGTYEGDRLVYAGRVGSGFDEATLAALAARLGRARARRRRRSSRRRTSPGTSCTGPSPSSSSRSRSASGPPRACCASRSSSACARTRPRARSCASGPNPRRPMRGPRADERRRHVAAKPPCRQARRLRRAHHGARRPDHQSREAALPGVDVPEALARRVLRGDRAGDAAPRRRTAADARALPARPRPGVLLPAPPRRGPLAADPHVRPHAHRAQATPTSCSSSTPPRGSSRSRRWARSRSTRGSRASTRPRGPTASSSTSTRDRA